MTSAFNPGATVRHPQHGAGVVEYQRNDLVTVDFGGQLQRVEASSLTPIESLSTALAAARLDDPTATLLRAQALAITSINDQWGVFSRSRVQILPHQLWVCRQVTRTWPFRWLVADDVGLGKTIEAGLILMPLIARDKVKRLLVLAPAKLVPQWQGRLKAMFDIRLQRYSPSIDGVRNSFWDTATAVVASFHTLRHEGDKRERLLEAEPWDLVIVDEAHHLNCDERIGDTLAYTLLAEMQQRGQINSLLLFTGTPHRGKDYGFFGLMQLLRPDLFDREKDRAEQLPHLREAVIRNNKATVTDLKGDRLFKPVTVSTRDYRYSLAEEEFYQTISAFIVDGKAYAGALSGRQQTARMLVLITLQKLAASSIAAIRSALTKRRDKLSSLVAGATATLKDLPDGDTELLDEDIAATDVQLVTDEIERLDELIALAKRVSAETKITRLVKLLDDELPSGEQVLLFTEYKATQALVVNALQARFGHGSCSFINGEERLEGVISPSGQTVALSIARDAAADNFNSGKVRFMISTEAGGEGIDLQERCSILIHVDMPWNPMRLHQRVGRLSRFGQKAEVTVFLLRNPDTVESRIWDLLNAKLQRIQAALSNVMEESEDITNLVIGIAGEALFTDLYAGAQGRSDDGLKHWFNQKTATLGGKDVIDTARDLYGNVARFDFQGVGRDVPQVDLPDLEAFFIGALRSNGRRVTRDAEGITFKAPDGWRKQSWSVTENYSRLVFDRTLKDEGATGRILGVGHQLVNLALAQALEADTHVASFLDLDAPILIMVVEDGITGTGASVRRMIFGIRDAVIAPMILRDWELLQLLNRISPGRASVAGAPAATNPTATALRLANHFQRNLPQSTELFARPVARPEMLLLPAGNAQNGAAAGSAPQGAPDE
ncbi:DEAD/DEAH box helicase [Bradyrhizobium sp. SZCCHNRI3052]|uniref:DEAD/DEAH box helicase n=1 Tax=Bradyrhizobium sp. SZCCHNRI3052 TaxID=3057295 RepID=UPI0029170CE3|nr:DEAD/DEAH box helicase [Bradyrhizobium sp. SZCCHNRI3052]